MTIGELFVLFGVKIQGEQFKAAREALTQLKIAIGLLEVAKLGRELVNMAQEAGTSATHILGMSSALGMSTKTVQEWSYVAQQAGSDINQFSVGISMFERNLKEFAAGRGSKRFIDSMQAIGMSRSEAKRDLAGPDGVNSALFKVSDAYLRMGNSANRAAINTGLFGARARGMAQDLGRGSGVLREQIAHVHAIGGIVGDNELQNLKKFNNAINDIKVAWHGVTMVVIGELAPMLTKLLQEVTTFIVENKEAIREVLQVGFEMLALVFKAIMGVVRFFAAAIEGNRAAQAVLFTLASILLYVLLPALYAVAVAAWAAITPLLVPMAIIAGIAAIGYAVMELVDHWDEVAEAFRQAGRDVVKTWDAWTGAILRTAKAVAYGAKNALDVLIHLPGAARDAVMELGHSIKQFLVDQWHRAGAAIDDYVEEFKAKIRAAKREFAGLFNWIPGVHFTWGQEPAKRSAPTSFTPGGAPQPLAALQPMFAPENALAQNFLQAKQSPQQYAFAPAGSMAAMTAAGPRKEEPRLASVSVGPTTINIIGVKNAMEAQDHIADSIDGVHRHAAAAMAGEVS